MWPESGLRAFTAAQSGTLMPAHFRAARLTPGVVVKRLTGEPRYRLAGSAGDADQRQVSWCREPL